jgi:hypothetical protein
MFVVPVEINISTIDGKGVFPLRKIHKGEIVWKFDAAHDKVLSVDQFNALAGNDRVALKRVAYLSPTSHQYVYPPEGDAARFTNHSSENNLTVEIDKKVSEEPYFIANRDIEEGMELTNNYTEFDEAIKTYKPNWVH